jgi:hypothetical protein
MKGKINNESNLVRRAWSEHRRVRNYHPGSRRLRRLATHNSSKSRGKADALGSCEVCSDRKWFGLDEQGSVTAEFAVVLPGVLLILYFALAVLALQSSRIALVGLAAEGSRALARGEPELVVSELISQSGLGPNTGFETSFSELSICVEVVQRHQITALGATFPIDLKEVQCARKGGL